MEYVMSQWRERFRRDSVLTQMRQSVSGRNVLFGGK